MAGATCRACGAPLSAAPPSIARSATPAPPASSAAGAIDPAFDRDRFLLRQPLISLNAKYDVWDEAGTSILFIERPAHLGRNLLATLAAVGAGAVMVILTLVIVSMVQNSDLGVLLTIVGILAAMVTMVAVGVALSQKRHITFYRDVSKAERVLSVQQDQKFAFLVQTFTIQDPAGNVLGIARKNWLSDILRKKWRVHGPSGEPLFEAREDLAHAILSRIVAKLFPMNFHFHLAGRPEELGHFDRKFTVRDRYVLDMSPDRGRLIDRRLALAMGVLLDTGEKR